MDTRSRGKDGEPFAVLPGLHHSTEAPMRFISTLAVVAATTLGTVAAGIGIANAGPNAPTPPPNPSANQVVAEQTALAATIEPNPMAVYVPLKNCRVVATATAGGKIPNGATRDFQVTGTTGFTTQGGTSGGCGIPAYATAVSARVTSTASDANGAFIAYPTGTPVGQGTLYYAKGVNVTTGSNLQIGTAGKVTVKNVQGPSHLAIDVNGYFSPQIQGHVELDGTLTSGTPLVVSALRSTTGVYQVTTARNVSTCAAHADPDGSGGYISSAVPSGSTVTVYTYALNGTPTNIRFTLSVTC
ncbi:hypothetical protein [Terracoccus sp. 273MFTsu3.1]|uniref:hypothetical protein n=1 Tax=Terracoccus sp. 273MFTsu3.1 TaxID=1172188 RepID=UPI00036BB9C6|nr:hypothetical protein [Terracoccus sp. 273MFTsu3.1]